MIHYDAAGLRLLLCMWMMGLFAKDYLTTPKDATRTDAVAITISAAGTAVSVPRGYICQVTFRRTEPSSSLPLYGLNRKESHERLYCWMMKPNVFVHAV
jgi:hypothetical protein